MASEANDKPNIMPWVLGGVGAAALLGIGGVLVLRKDDGSGTAMAAQLAEMQRANKAAEDARNAEAMRSAQTRAAQLEAELQAQRNANAAAAAKAQADALAAAQAAAARQAQPAPPPPPASSGGGGGGGSVWGDILGAAAGIFGAIYGNP